MTPPRRPARLAPSLLSADFADLAGAIRAAEAGDADAFHLDVMDGHFVPNISFGPALVAAVRARTTKPLDVHLMVSRPIRLVRAFREAGGDTLVVHLESEDDPTEAIARIRELGGSPGIAVRPGTPIARAAPLAREVDQLMVMGVHPGFSGQSYLPETPARLAEARRLLDEAGSSADLSIDGGVTVAIARDCARAGASFFVCGSSVFGRGTVGENLRSLRGAVEEGRRDALR